MCACVCVININAFPMSYNSFTHALPEPTLVGHTYFEHVCQGDVYLPMHAYVASPSYSLSLALLLKLLVVFLISSLPSPLPLSQYPTMTLYPPHYDAVSSFAIHNNHLFSACGCSFKQWDTNVKQLKQVSLTPCRLSVCLSVCPQRLKRK